MADFKTMRAGADNKKNVRKALGAVVFIAPMTAEPIEKLTSTDKTLADIPADYRPLGMFTEDGLEFSKEISAEEVRALGYMQEVRRDNTSETHGISLTALELDRRIISELRYGIDLSAVRPDTNGEIHFDVPDTTVNRQYRLLAIAQDINKETGAEIYRAKMYRNIEVSEFPTESWSTDPLSAEFSFSARSDDDGVVFREFHAGPGLDPEDLGYTTTV